MLGRTAGDEHRRGTEESFVRDLTEKQLAFLLSTQHHEAMTLQQDTCGWVQAIRYWHAGWAHRPLDPEQGRGESAVARPGRRVWVSSNPNKLAE
jgi:hypothetical protein